MLLSDCRFSPGQLHRQLRISLHYSAALILISPSLLWHLNTEPEGGDARSSSNTAAEASDRNTFFLCFAYKLLTNLQREGENASVVG